MPDAGSILINYVMTQHSHRHKKKKSVIPYNSEKSCKTNEKNTWFPCVTCDVESRWEHQELPVWDGQQQQQQQQQPPLLPVGAVPTSVKLWALNNRC
jgi:hypothetical protein